MFGDETWGAVSVPVLSQRFSGVESELCGGPLSSSTFINLATQVILELTLCEGSHYRTGTGLDPSVPVKVSRHATAETHYTVVRSFV